VVLADRLELSDDGTFLLLGRQGDLVKVAGKRASLADLTARLLSIPGVEDGVIVEPSALGAEDGDRLCAFVVAPGLSAEAIRRRLAQLIDPAFLPRPLKVVAQLPRSQTGKLTRETLEVLLDAGAGKR
jgi:acyl-coenzyme A synthetase/AMP-(fatty) acid ligase